MTLLITSVRVPERLRDVGQQDAIIREYEYDHTTAIAVDFGPETGDISIDTIDETAIVVAGGEQFEFEFPKDANEVATNNGILTIEG